MQLGRQDGYRVTFSAFPGERASNSPRAFTTCYVEAYATSEGAINALDGIGPNTFPANVQVREDQSELIGESARTFEGTIADTRTNQQVAVIVIVWRRGRYVATVTIRGAPPQQALGPAQRLGSSMDGRIAQLR